MSYRFRDGGGGTRRPVVLLLGWLGSHERYLNKYTQLWQDLGASVIAHQPSILQTALPAVADRALLRLMKDVTLRYSPLCTVGGQAPPVLMHVMSNAGFIAAGTMLHLVSLLQSPVAGYGGTARGADADRPRLEFDPAAWAAGRGGGGMTAARSYRLWGGPEGRRWQRWGGSGGQRDHAFVSDPSAMAVLSAYRQVLRNTQGIVVDSAPSQVTAAIWSRGLMSAVFRQPAQDIEDHPLLLRAAHRLAERYLSAPVVAQRMREVRRAWAFSVPPCPQLFLYSQAYALIPYQHVEHFMEQQAAHGIPVQHHCWPDAPHCELLRKHPEQYRNLVHSFAQHCLHGHTPPETWI